MKYLYEELKTSAIFHLISGDESFSRKKYKQKNQSLLTITWNRGPSQIITLDGEQITIPHNAILPLMGNQAFNFENPADIVAWQFNREFYCIINHDKEVSCVGFIFYGSKDHLVINLDSKSEDKLSSLFKIFMDEIEEEDNIQGEMLRMLLKRLIIMITRLGKQQYNSSPELKAPELDIVRQFNLEVEQHFKKYHQVQDYAVLLNKSPKTPSDLFSMHNEKSPLQVIRERITLEAKRLIIYTEQSLKEIAYELGFDDPTGFSRFFKNQTGLSPSNFRKSNLAD